MNNKIFITILILFTVIGLTKYTVDSISDSKKAELQREKDILNKRIQCNNDADRGYRIMWDNACEEIGRPDNCFLPTHDADYITEVKIENKKNCNYLYN